VGEVRRHRYFQYFGSVNVLIGNFVCFDIICGVFLSCIFQILNVGSEAGELKAGTKV